MSLRSLSIRARLIGAFALLTLFILGLGALAYTATRTINGHLVQVQSDWLPSVSKAGEIDAWAARYAISVFRHIASENAEQVEQADAEVAARGQKVGGLLAGYAGPISLAEEQALYDELKREWAAEETGAAASLVLASASELSRQSEHLAGEVRRFLHTVRAA